MLPARTVRALAVAGLAAVAVGAAGCDDDDCGPLDDGWLGYVTHRDHRYQLRLVRADGRCDRPVANVPRGQLAPSISLSAGVLVHWEEAGELGELVVRGLLWGKVHVLDTGALQVQEPEVSPDGSLVAFRGRTPPERSGDLYVLPMAGGEPVVVAPSPADDAHPSWSADGRTLYFTSNRSGRFQIWRVGFDGGEPVQVSTDDTAALTCGAAACPVQGKAAASPDGAHLAFTRATPEGQGTVVIRALDTGLERVLAPGVPCTDPSYSRSGRELALLDVSWNDPEIAVRDAETGALVTRITSRRGSEASPSFAR